MDVKTSISVPMHDSNWSVRFEEASVDEVSVSLFWSDKLEPTHTARVKKVDLREAMALLGVPR